MFRFIHAADPHLDKHHEHLIQLAQETLGNEGFNLHRLAGPPFLAV
jgi:hypothetical protein